MSAYQAVEYQMHLLNVLESEWGENALRYWWSSEGWMNKTSLKKMEEKGKDTIEIVAKLCGYILESGTPFHWTPNCVELVKAAAKKLPDNFTLGAEDLIVKTGFFHFPQPYANIQLNEKTLPNKVHSESDTAFGWHYFVDEELGPHINVVGWANMKLGDESGGIMDVPEPIPIRMYSMRLDEVTVRSMADDYANENNNGGAVPARIERNLFEIAAMLFAGQELVNVWPQRAPRAARRRAQAANEPPPKDVRVISLRRQHSEAHDASKTSMAEWSCRWAVRGHWRNQFYPSKGTNRTIWIDPYVKGPDNKPFRATTSIFSVHR